MEMQSKKLIGNKVSAPTQKYLDIAEIKEDTIILRDGSLRAVIAVSSVNFSLKSESEQNALIAAYQGFLNSIEFPIQILIQSRVLDIDSYLEKMRNLASGQSNELLRVLMGEYIEYVDKLVEFSNIMSKTFYVIVPYSNAPLEKETFFSNITKIFNPAGKIATQTSNFQKDKIKLEERLNRVLSELGGMGLRSIILNTEELIELMYGSYNFDSATPLHVESLKDIEIEPEKKIKTEV